MYPRLFHVAPNETKDILHNEYILYDSREFFKLTKDFSNAMTDLVILVSLFTSGMTGRKKNILDSAKSKFLLLEVILSKIRYKWFLNIT